MEVQFVAVQHMHEQVRKANRGKIHRTHTQLQHPCIVLPAGGLSTRCGEGKVPTMPTCRVGEGAVAVLDASSHLRWILAAMSASVVSTPSNAIGLTLVPKIILTEAVSRAADSE
jgi:hypothetical protein